jgi:hypothetical protein
MDEFQRGPNILPNGELSLRLVPVRRALLLLIGTLAIGKRLVVHPSAFLKLLLKDTPLAVREVDAVFEALTHNLRVTHPCLKSKFVLLRTEAAEASKGLLSQG